MKGYITTAMKYKKPAPATVSTKCRQNIVKYRISVGTLPAVRNRKHEFLDNPVGAAN